MDRDEFMELVYETFADEPDNVLANGIIDAADAYVEHEKTQLFQQDTTKGTASDMISRQAAIDRICESANDLQDVLIPVYYRKLIENLPSAQPETAKRIVGKSRDGMTLWYQCDMCNEPVDEQDSYCRGCGRRLIDG